jgi:hypothetical protein
MWATVTQASPLRVQVDGDTTPIPATPVTLAAPLAVGDRVRCELENNRLIVHGRYGGPAADALLAGRNRNLIINGDWRLSRRGYTSNAALALGAYGPDRWKSNNANTAIALPSGPNGGLATIGFYSPATFGAIRQVVERANLAPATRSYVLSWAGTALGRFYKAGTAAPSYAASPIVGSLDGLADCNVEFATGSASLTLGEVQLELGTAPTPFERRSLAEELALAQRYFESGSIKIFANGTSYVVLAQNYRVLKRASPTLAFLSTTSRTTMPTSTEWNDPDSFGVGRSGSNEVAAFWTSDAEL